MTIQSRDTSVINFGGVFNVKNPAYGAKCDGKNLTDVTTTNGGAISSASYTFVAGDVGKLITIAGAAAAGAVLNTSIASVSAGQATLTTPPSTAIAGTAVATFGTDDTVAIQAAVTAATAAGGGNIFLPAGISIISSITWATNVSLFGSGAGKSILKHIKTSDATVAMIYVADTGGGSHTYIFDCQFRDFELDMSAATDASYQVLASCIRIPHSKRSLVQGVYAHDSPATCLAFDYASECVINSSFIENGGRLNGGTNLGGAGIGCAIGGNDLNSFVVTNNVFLTCCTYAVFFEVETAATTVDARAICNNNVIFLSSAGVSAIGDAGCRRFECIGNNITTVGTANTGDAITVKKGTTNFDPGQTGLIADNIITSSGANGISIDYTTNIPAGQKCAYTIRGNQIQAAVQSGIKINANASSVLDTLLLEDNKIFSCSLNGIALTGAGGMQDVTIRDNTIFNNGASGSGITASGVGIQCTQTRLRMVGNTIFDNGTGTQKYALAVNTSIAVSGAFLDGNDLSNNATGAINLISGATIAGWVSNNKGYNPIGASSVTPAASPWTYTAGATPEVLYLFGGTVSNISKNSIQIASASPAAVSLDPGEAVVVTYSVVPTAAKDQK